MGIQQPRVALVICVMMMTLLIMIALIPPVTISVIVTASAKIVRAVVWNAATKM